MLCHQPIRAQCFLLLSLLTVHNNSSAVKITSIRNSSFLQDRNSKSHIYSFRDIMSRVSPNLDSPSFRKCSHHTFKSFSRFFIVSPLPTSLGYLDFFVCGVLNLLLSWATNNLSFFCTRNLSGLASYVARGREGGRKRSSLY